jgi:hypothetical protein
VGIAVTVLTTGRKVRGFKPGRERFIFKGFKNRSTSSFGEEVKPSASCKILRHVKIRVKHDRDISSAKFKDYFSPSPCVATRCVCCNQRPLVHDSGMTGTRGRTIDQNGRSAWEALYDTTP